MLSSTTCFSGSMWHVREGLAATGRSEGRSHSLRSSGSTNAWDGSSMSLSLNPGTAPNS